MYFCLLQHHLVDAKGPGLVMQKAPKTKVSSVLRAPSCSAACISQQSPDLEEASVLQTEVAMVQSHGPALISAGWTPAALSQ